MKLQNNRQTNYQSNKNKFIAITYINLYKPLKIFSLKVKYWKYFFYFADYKKFVKYVNSSSLSFIEFRKYFQSTYNCVKYFTFFFL